MINNSIQNNVYLSYTFTVDPSTPNGASASATTPIVLATISYADLLTTGNFTKSVNKAYAGKGDTVTYTVVASNTGNVTATNITLTDIIPSNATYVTNSLTVNGVGYNGNPNNGISLTSIPPNSTTYLTFSALINSAPAVNPMINTASIVYHYTIDPSVPNGGTGNGITNSAYTTITYADLFSSGNFIKTSSGTQIGVSDVLTYSFLVRNTGNTTANNAIIYDTLPYGTTFVTGSVSVNGSSSAATPSGGITLPDIAPGQVIPVSFNVTVDTISSINPLINRAFVGYKFTQDPSVPLGKNASAVSTGALTQVVPTITVTKSVNPQYVLVGDTVVYTVVISNPNNLLLTNLTLNDLLAPEVAFIPGSVVINSVAAPHANVLTGVNINAIGANGVATIQFNATVLNKGTGLIPNASNLTYNYLGTNTIPLTATQYSNTNILNANIASVSVNKSTPLTTVTAGVTIPYTVLIQNTGDVNLYDVLFRDILSPKVNFITSSFTVNGVTVNVDPVTVQRGVDVGSLPIGAMTTITFDVILKPCFTDPETYKLGNSAYFMYNYVLPDGTGGLRYSPMAATTITKV